MYVISQNITGALAGARVVSRLCITQMGGQLAKMLTGRFMQVKITLNFVDFSMCKIGIGLHWLLWRRTIFVNIRTLEPYFINGKTDPP